MGKIRGQAAFDKFKLGRKLTRREAMAANCFQCNGLKESKADCEVDNCPMFQYRLYPTIDK